MNEVLRPLPNPGVMDIAAYVPGKESVEGVKKIYKLSSNESPMGASPAAIEAARNVLDKTEFYPDGQSTELREAIASVHGLNPANIMCTAGSDEGLALLIHTYMRPGDEGIFTEHGFLVYRIYIQAAGGVPVAVKEKDERADVDAILAAVTERTRIVFLANPNNPTGTYLPFEEVRRLQAGLPPHVMLVLDAAYAEYVRKNDYEAGIELVSSCQNVVMARTFSKIHGLAGLRIGWLYAPAHILDALNRVRSPFNMNAPAIAAGSAAIRDREHVERAAQHNEKWLAWVTEQLTGLGLRVTPSVANFVLVHFDGSGKTAQEVDSWLSRRGFIPRGVAAYGFPNSLRITIGSEEANLGFVAALKELFAR